MTTRRGFLSAILAAAAAPVFIRAGVLMPVRKIVVPEWLEIHGVDDVMLSGSTWSPATLFQAGSAWYDAGDIRTLFQDAEGTIPACLGSRVARMDDKLGRGSHVLFSKGFCLEKDADGQLYVG